MEKEYRELFDGVRASGRLRMEVMNMKREETKRVRRVPRAALIAAALVLALAGTAVAAELLGHVQIDLKNPNETNTSGDGYTGGANFQTIPAENLSEAALERAAEIEDAFANWGFDSWSDAAAFLGLELQSSPKLEELPPVKKKGGCNAMVLAHSGEEQQRNVPFFILLSTTYQADGCRVTQSAHMEFQYPGYPQREAGLGFANHRGETHLEEYTTPSGIQASIITTTQKIGSAKAVDYTTHIAYWVTDNILYSLQTSIHDPVDHPDSVHAVEILKDILDSYE